MPTVSSDEDYAALPWDKSNSYSIWGAAPGRPAYTLREYVTTDDSMIVRAPAMRTALSAEPENAPPVSRARAIFAAIGTRKRPAATGLEERVYEIPPRTKFAVITSLRSPIVRLMTEHEHGQLAADYKDVSGAPLRLRGTVPMELNVRKPLAPAQKGGGFLGYLERRWPDRFGHLRIA